MPRFARILLPLAVLCLLVGCSLWEAPVNQPVRTPRRSPSVVVSGTPAGGSDSPANGTPANGPDASLQPGPSNTRRPTATFPTPTITITPTITRTPTLTPTITSTATLNPKAIQLRIAAPGPMSKVISPIEFVAHISPDFVGTTRIELIGEDGRSLFAKSFRTFATESTTKVTQRVDFEIPGTAEVARLQISTYDKNGQMKAFNSVRLLLIAVGENQLSPPYPAVERTLLRLPKWGSEAVGGLLTVQGEMQPINKQPVIVELFGADGSLLGSRLLTFGPDNGTYQPFNTIIPYQVEAKTDARLVIHQDDDRLIGLAYLYSVELQISP
jgi:hypothetical protein